MSAEKETSGAVAVVGCGSIRSMGWERKGKRDLYRIIIDYEVPPRLPFNAVWNKWPVGLVFLNQTPPSQERANPSPPHAERLPTRISASTDSSEIDPAPSPGVQTISGACHNGGSSPSVLHKRSDTPPTEGGEI